MLVLPRRSLSGDNEQGKSACSYSWMFLSSLAVGGFLFVPCNISTQKQHLTAFKCIVFVLPRQDHFINVKQSFSQIFLNHSNPKQLAHLSASTLAAYFRSSDLENYDTPTPTMQPGLGQKNLYSFLLCLYFIYLGRVSCSLELPILLPPPSYPSWELVLLPRFQLQCLRVRSGALGYTRYTCESSGHKLYPFSRS